MMQGELVERDAQSWKYSDGHMKGSNRFKSYLIERIGNLSEAEYKFHFRSPVSASLFICDAEIEFDKYVEKVGMTRQ